MSKLLNKDAHLYTETGWEIIEKQFDPDQSIISGSNFLLGNGYLGYRGTFIDDEKEDYVACIVTDTFDMADGKWRELCNAPNGLYLHFLSGGKPVTFNREFYDYERQLDLQHGIFKRTTTYDSEFKVSIEKFASLQDVNLLAMQIELEAMRDLELTIASGIDTDVWSLNGDHFESINARNDDGLLIASALTQEFEIDLEVVELTQVMTDDRSYKVDEDDGKLLRTYTITLEKGETLSIEKFVSIFTSNDTINPLGEAKNLIQGAQAKGYAILKQEQMEAWEQLWDDYDIQISGNAVVQTLTRFNLYHNIIATPRQKQHPIGARGLSCQAYQGAAFWDQEIFNMPMFLYTTPDIAKNILKYRYDTLNGARQKAKRLGYQGAFYAWISGKTGQELCPDYFFKDVLTGRKIRNHFNDWQIHISPDITYAIDHYLQATDDWEFIEDYGAEMMFEIAEFLRTRVHFKVDKDRYEVIRVLGPDEWHENVDNNIFTNFQVKYALEKTLAVYERLAQENPERLNHLKEKINITDATVNAWRDIYEKIFIQPVDDDTNLIEQFDGFFDLERIMPEALEKRLINEEEYWGWPNGIAISTQVSKQADLVQLFVMHPNAYDLKVQQDNYHFYEPVCRHGSSLSPAMHAIVASRIGDIEEAYRYFYIASTIDLFNTNEAVVGGTFIGGVHTAAAGAIWQVLVYGFAGVSFEGDKILVNPGLPKEFDQLSFKLHYKKNVFQLKVSNEQIIVDAIETNSNVFTIAYDALDYRIAPGETLVIKA